MDQRAIYLGPRPKNYSKFQNDVVPKWHSFGREVLDPNVEDSH